MKTEQRNYTYGRTTVGYEGPVPNVFAGGAFGGGIGAVVGFLIGGVKGAIILGAAGAALGGGLAASAEEQNSQ